MIRVVAGLMQRLDKFLIAKRPVGKPYSGYWELPGGKIEAHESSFAALAREMEEEIGIKVLHAQCLLQHEHVYPDKSIHLELWRITDYQGEPVSLEQQILRWATLQEIHTLKILEGNVALFAKLQALSGSGSYSFTRP